MFASSARDPFAGSSSVGPDRGTFRMSEMGRSGSTASNSSISSGDTIGSGYNAGPPVPPPFAVLNPVAARMPSESDNKRWYPVPDLVPTKESMFFRAAVARELKKTHEEITPAELEIRANTPEYKVLQSDWVAHTANNQMSLMMPLKAVCRIPASLILEDPNNADGRNSRSSSYTAPNTTAPAISGFLRKKGEKNTAFRQRYMELNGSVLSYYKKKPEKNGIPFSREDKKAYERGAIDLERVSSMQPMEATKAVQFGIQLVTTARTWVIAADTEQEYQRWLKALCEVVKFSAVNITFRRMFQLQEVSAKAITDVRMVIATGDTVGEIVEHIFNCYKQALDAAPLKPYDPSKYLLKITGFRDYLIDRYRVVNEYMYVRECLLTKKTIRLTVIHESVIQETAMRSLSIRTDLPFHRSGSLSSQFADTWDASNNEYQAASALSMTALNISSSEWDGPTSLFGGAPQPKRKPVSSAFVHEPFRIRIWRVLNIPRTTCVLKRSSEEAVIEYRPLMSSSVIVRIDLYDGGQLLDTGVLDTEDVRLRAQRDDLLYAEWTDPTWHTFNIDISAITRSMRIQLTVLGVKNVIGGAVLNTDMREERMLVTGINAFEVDGYLTQGMQYVQMLRNLHSCTQGPVPHFVMPTEPLITVELPKYDVPILFDWSGTSEETGGEDDNNNVTMMERYSRRTMVVSNRATTLRKEGWLQKLGFSKYLTKWRRRWFVVDQSTCTLSYADDAHAPAKRIPLKNCSVTFADEMNLKYTTAPVNKGTRKERQTWCFKVRPQNSSRDYIILAETKQEREEWMLAIHTVSKGDTLDNNDMMREAISIKAPSFRPIDEADETACTDNNADEDDGKNILHSLASDMRRDSTARSSGNSSTLRIDSIINDLRHVILMDPLYRLSGYQKEQMWKQREEFTNIPAALPRILSCVHWGDKDEVEEALELLPRWAEPENVAAYIELLNGEFANESVRQFAVDKLATMADTTFSYFLPQLVQALKFENHHVSPLAMLLISRAIKNPNQIGFDLFWAMKVESHNAQYRERYGTLLNAYLDVSSQKMRAILKLQDKLFSADGMFERICQSIKAKKREGPEEMKRVMREGLESLNEILPSSFQLPIDPRIEVGKIIVSKCRVMDSAKKPLWLVFENAEEGGDTVAVMFKAGDDVRQDCLTLQLIRLMDEMWRDEGLNLAMEPYRCVATSPMTGILEMVPNSVTTADVQKRDGILGAFKDPSFSDWIRANNPDRRGHREAVDLFSRSCAGYCVATCVLGIGDRHNDNIMVRFQLMDLVTSCCNQLTHVSELTDCLQRPILPH